MKPGNKTQLQTNAERLVVYLSILIILNLIGAALLQLFKPAFTYDRILLHTCIGNSIALLVIFNASAAFAYALGIFYYQLNSVFEPVDLAANLLGFFLSALVFLLLKFFSFLPADLAPMIR